MLCGREGAPHCTAANYEGGMEMDIRIGAKSLIYGSRNASKVTDKELKISFAIMMEETKRNKRATEMKTAVVGKGSAESGGNALAQRLENVHKKIEEMDFTEKYSYEAYKSIYDAYEAEFGYWDMLFYLDEDTHNIIYKDREAVFASKIPGYSSRDIRLFRYAMGYDEMSKEEIIASIEERVGGNSYVHKICKINELERAGVLTPMQGHKLYLSLKRQAGKEYCAKMGFDYIKWSADPEQYYANPYGDGIPRWDIYFMAWAAETETNWLQIIESIHDYDPMWKWERETFLKELGDTKELLIESDKA